MRNFPEETMKKYTVSMERGDNGKKIIFKILNAKKSDYDAVATLEKPVSTENYYKLKDINSFNEEKGIGTALVQSINEFIESKGASISAQVENSRVSFFKNRGWATLGSPGSQRTTMVYNMDSID